MKSWLDIVDMTLTVIWVIVTAVLVAVVVVLVMLAMVPTKQVNVTWPEKRCVSVIDEKGERPCTPGELRGRYDIVWVSEDYKIRK